MPRSIDAGVWKTSVRSKAALTILRKCELHAYRGVPLVPARILSVGRCRALLWLHGLRAACTLVCYCHPTTSVHPVSVLILHHGYDYTRSDDTIISMWYYDTEVCTPSDSAQRVSIAKKWRRIRNCRRVTWRHPKTDLTNKKKNTNQNSPCISSFKQRLWAPPRAEHPTGCLLHAKGPNFCQSPHAIATWRPHIEYHTDRHGLWKRVT